MLEICCNNDFVLVAVVFFKFILGDVLETKEKTSKNPDIGTQIQSFSFTGQYSFSNTDQRPESIDKKTTNINNVNYDQVETFA